MIALRAIHPDPDQAEGERDRRGLILPGTPFTVFSAKTRDMLAEKGLARKAGAEGEREPSSQEQEPNKAEE